MTSKTKRHFTLVEPDGSEHGRYSGQTAKLAASKAFNKLKKDDPEAYITMRETTQGSDHRTSQFHCIREKLDKPFIKEIKDANGNLRKIKFEYRSKVEQIK